MKLHKVDLDPVTYQVDINKVKRLINRNTVLLVGSAPNYPHGIIDDIEALSDLAVKYNIPLHVDACLGSFIVTFWRSQVFTATRSFLCLTLDCPVSLRSLVIPTNMALHQRDPPLSCTETLNFESISTTSQVIGLVVCTAHLLLRDRGPVL